MKMARRSLVTWGVDSFIETDHVVVLSEGGFLGIPVLAVAVAETAGTGAPSVIIRATCQT